MLGIRPALVLTTSRPRDLGGRSGRSSLQPRHHRLDGLDVRRQVVPECLDLEGDHCLRGWNLSVLDTVVVCEDRLLRQGVGEAKPGLWGCRGSRLVADMGSLDSIWGRGPKSPFAGTAPTPQPIF